MLATWKNVTIIGTSHISRNSVKEIKRFFDEQHPDVVCIELDAGRYQALMNDEKPSLNLSLIRIVGVSGFLFALVGRFMQKKLGNIVGTAPGDDMKTAAELALQAGVPLKLIDQHILQTLGDFSKKFTLREKARLFKDLFIPPKEARTLSLRSQDLHKVPDDATILQLLSFISARYPGLYDALIGKRNKHMARALFRLHHEPAGKKILAVVGAGHVDGMLSELKSLERRVDVLK